MSYTPFSVTAYTPSSSPPDVFFPAVTPVISEADLIARTTVGVAPGASVVILIGTSRYTLTAGTAAVDSTHLRPSDYDATANAKYWLKV